MNLIGTKPILLRVHEMALKGGNKRWFEKIFIRNIQKQFKSSLGHSVKLKQERGRIFLLPPYPEEIKTTLNKCFGLSSFSQVSVVSSRHEDILNKALEIFEELFSTRFKDLSFPYQTERSAPRTFRIRSKRSEKSNAILSSMDLDCAIGAKISSCYPNLKVDLKKADITIRVEVRDTYSLVWATGHPIFESKGPGGLPVGSNAPLLALLSGGHDSPIAALRTLQRGSPTSFIHFYGAPFVEVAVLDKVFELTKVINQYQPNPGVLRVVPFGKIQEKIALVTNPKLRTILYRRMMIRIACKVAEKNNILAIVTGESLGQVASQTVENIHTINQSADRPILRPLIGFDKDEIISLAKYYGTFNISSLPAVDCCTLFSDRHPSLRSTLSMIEEQETRFPTEDFANEAISQMIFKSH